VTAQNNRAALNAAISAYTLGIGLAAEVLSSIVRSLFDFVVWIGQHFSCCRACERRLVQLKGQIGGPRFDVPVDLFYAFQVRICCAALVLCVSVRRA
jgi:hypothetical protein